MLTDQLAQAQWRLNRAHAAETKVFDLLTEDAFIRLGANLSEVDDSVNNLLGNALLNFDNHRVMANLNRYVIAAERTRQRALKELQCAQQKRRASPAPPPQPKVAVAAGQPLAPIPEIPLTGFESQFVSGEQGCLRTRLNPSSALRMASFRNHQKPNVSFTRPVALLDGLVNLFRSEMIPCMGTVIENFV